MNRSPTEGWRPPIAERDWRELAYRQRRELDDGQIRGISAGRELRVRNRCGDIAGGGAAAFEGHQPVLYVEQDAVRGRKHQVGSDCNPATKMPLAGDQHDMTRDRSVGQRCASDQRGRRGAWEDTENRNCRDDTEHSVMMPRCGCQRLVKPYRPIAQGAFAPFAMAQSGRRARQGDPAFRYVHAGSLAAGRPRLALLPLEEGLLDFVVDAQQPRLGASSAIPIVRRLGFQLSEPLLRSSQLKGKLVRQGPWPARSPPSTCRRLSEAAPRCYGRNHRQRYGHPAALSGLGRKE